MTARNVIILSADSLDEKHFRKHFGTVEDKLDAVRFRDAVATASNTNSSVPALSAGVYAETLDQNGLPESGPPVPVAEQFEKEGYTCGLWTDNFLFGERFNYDRGFEGGNVGRISNTRKIADILEGHPFLYSFAKECYFRLVSPFLELTGDGGGVWKEAEELHTEAMNWMAEIEGEKFCWIHYMDTHHPYMPPKEILEDAEFNHSWTRHEIGQFSQKTVYSSGEDATETELEDVHTAYELTCKSLANEMEQFISWMMEEDQFDPEKDMLVITADHGESFLPNIHGQMGHKSLWEKVVKVPLLISHPDWEPATIKGQVSLIDLMPTILKLNDIPIPDTAQGQGYERPEQLVRELAYFSNAQPWYKTKRGIRSSKGEKIFGHQTRDNNYELIHSRYNGEKGWEESIIQRNNLQDLDSFKSHIAGDQELNELLEMIEERGDLVGNGEDFAMDEELQSQLENLGYME